MIIFPLITTWMWFEAAMTVQSLSNNTLRKLVAGPTVFIANASNSAWTSSVRRTSPRW